MRELSSLQTLYLGYNIIQKVPPFKEMAGLANLIELDLSNNRLVEIGEGMRFMSQLQLLNLDNNSLQNLPLELGLLQNAKSLTAGGNPLKTIKQEIVLRGGVAVRDFLRSKIPMDSPMMRPSPSTESKMVVASEESLRLENRIADVEKQLQDLSISSAKQYALKMELAKAKADLNRLRRKESA